MNTQAHSHGSWSTEMGGIETIIPPDGPRLVQVRAPLYPNIETVVCGVAVAAASVNMLSFGQASDIAYTDVPDADFLEVYLHPNTFTESALHRHETTPTSFFVHFRRCRNLIF